MKTTTHFYSLKLAVTALIYILFLQASSLYSQVQNNGNLRIHSNGNLSLFGDFTNNGTMSDNQGTLTFAGNTLQTINGSNLIQSNNIHLNKTSNSVHLDNELQVSGAFTFSNGIMTSDRNDASSEYLHFLDNATYSGASNTSYLDGVIKKTGNDGFIFPVGENGYLRTIAISAPSNITDHFTAQYTESDPDPTYDQNSLDGILNHVSSCEYWQLDRTGGSSTIQTTLSWNTTSCGVNDLCDLQIAKWDGSQWNTEGNGGTSGSTSNGTIVSGTTCTTPGQVSDFGVFTLASLTSNNPLPVEFITFDAILVNRQVKLKWMTYTEINNELFEVERSPDGYTWNTLTEVPGAGNSNISLAYSALDQAPLTGTSYYRIKQLDFDGSYDYTEVKTIQIDKGGSSISFTPNPTRNILKIQGDNINIEDLRICDLSGNNLFSSEIIQSHGNQFILLDLTPFPSGSYIASIKAEKQIIIKL